MNESDRFNIAESSEEYKRLRYLVDTVVSFTMEKYSPEDLRNAAALMEASEQRKKDVDMSKLNKDAMAFFQGLVGKVYVHTGKDEDQVVRRELRKVVRVQSAEEWSVDDEDAHVGTYVETAIISVLSIDHCVDINVAGGSSCYMTYHANDEESNQYGIDRSLGTEVDPTIYRELKFTIEADATAVWNKIAAITV